MNVSDLHGQALDHYRYWRETLGLSEAAALRRVQESGILVEQQLEEAFKNMGMSDNAARHAARGRDGGARPADPFDGLVESFERLGLSPDAARRAAIGRDGTEYQARRHLGESARPLQESATVPLVRLVESGRLVEAGGSSRYRARLIAGDIQGSSGYYPAQMLRESAGAFHKDLPVYFDHPTQSEAYERPERSVRDLAGRLVEAARYEGDGLYSTIEFFSHALPVVEALGGFVGLSIRASGETKPSMSESVRGPIITAITYAESVDLVTRPGAGGRIVGRAA